MKKTPIAPWTPVEAEQQGNACSVEVWDRTYTVDSDLLFTSIKSRGNEILSAPMRLVGIENGEEIVWTEQAPFIFEQDGEMATLCASAESTTFIVNTAMKVEFDGNVDIDIKIMPRGKTVYEVFGVGTPKPNEYSLDKLWLEIPLKKQYSKLFHYWPTYGHPTFEGKGIEPSDVSMSREIPSSMALPFKCLLWLGTEEQGLTWYADSDESWEPADRKRAIEIIDGEDEVVVRFHLIDDTCKAWVPHEREAKNYTYMPISFKMGLQATPVKPFPKNPYKEKILHIDCFKKILEEYDDFLSKPVVEGTDEIGFDRIKRLGVTTLLIHEKWNKTQNYWKISEPTRKLARKIVDECHKRGIKVIPYFGYELSTLSPDFSKYRDSLRVSQTGLNGGGWYRKPNQRDYVVCFEGRYADDFVEGIKGLTEEFGFDGIYLDSTLLPCACVNEAHGCGYNTADGKRRPTYTVSALRRFMKKIYTYFEERGGVVNPHLSNCMNSPALSFAHLNWDGEYIQTFVNKNGLDAMPMDYLRTEYSARNLGVPYEFLVYTFPNWSFNDGISIALIHGMLPRPNDIGGPLEKMSGIWKAIDSFDMEGASWHPYWDNGVLAEDEKVKLSYYEAEENGKKSFLVFISNPTDGEAVCEGFSLTDKPVSVYSVDKNSEISGAIAFAPRGSDVLIVKEK